MPPSTCHRTLLAQSPQARIEACSCGVIHVNTGAITLRLDPAACEALTTTLARAMLEMAQQRAATQTCCAPQLRVVEGDA